MFLRALVLINDEHGYIKPGRIFRTGYYNVDDPDGGEVMIQERKFVKEVVEDYVRLRKACYIYNYEEEAT